MSLLIAQLILVVNLRSTQNQYITITLAPRSLLQTDFFSSLLRDILRNMGTSDYIIDVVLSVFLIIGAYQFYFFCQRHPWRRRAASFHTPLDDLVPYWPSWVWIYVGLYFPAILCANVVVKSPRNFTWMAMSYMTLLFVQMGFFLLLPVALPDRWRAHNSCRTRSERLLALVCRIDGKSNCFPSMHCSVAMLTALYMQPTVGNLIWGMPILIGLSAVFTKQHYIVDVPAGILLGWVVFRFYAHIL